MFKVKLTILEHMRSPPFSKYISEVRVMKKSLNSDGHLHYRQQN